MEGSPNLQYGPGTFAFRMPVLVLGLEPVVDAAAFPTRLQQTIAELLPVGVSLVGAGIFVGRPFMQSIPAADDMKYALMALMGQYITGAVFQNAAQNGAVALGADTIAAGDAGLAAMGGPHAAALIYGIPIAAIIGVGVGELGRLIVGRDQIVARWITVEGDVRSTSRPFDTLALGRAIARAMGDTVRFRHPTEPSRLVATDGASIYARLQAPDACSGGRRYDKVYAAACLRLDVSTRAAPPMQPPSQPSGPAPTAPPVRIERINPEPPTLWEDQGPRPTIPPEQLAPTSAQPTLAERAKKLAKPALVVVTVVSAVALGWSVLGHRVQTPDAPTETRLNGRPRRVTGRGGERS